MEVIVPIEAVERRIYLISGHKVMLDKDLTELYGVKPTRLREQVKRNMRRFPDDFMFQLNEQEIDIMRAFVKLREILSTNKELFHKLAQLERKMEKHDDDIKVIFNAIRQLMAPPQIKKKKIGFRTDVPSTKI